MDWELKKIIDQMERKGLEEGILLKDVYSQVPHFYLDCNVRKWRVVSDPEKILRFMQISREASGRENYGPHNALLRLVAKRLELANLTWRSPLWQRADDVSADKNPAKWISMQDWLAENGFPYTPSED